MFCSIILILNLYTHTYCTSELIHVGCYAYHRSLLVLYVTTLQTFQVFIVSGNVIKIYAEGGLVYSVHGLGTEVLFLLLCNLMLLKIPFLLL